MTWRCVATRCSFKHIKQLRVDHRRFNKLYTLVDNEQSGYFVCVFIELVDYSLCNKEGKVSFSQMNDYFPRQLPW